MKVEVQVVEHIATVRINRPDALNALDHEAKAQLREAWRRLEEPDVRVAVLTGAGDRAFCVGSDLKEGAVADVSFASEHLGDVEDPHLLRGLPDDVPMIAALNGHALGGGLELALACDIRIAAERATLGLPEVCVGSMPGAGGTQNLPRAISHSNAMYLLLTGERIDARRALEMGLVTEVVPHADLASRAHELAAKIASNAPLAVRAVRRMARLATEVSPEVGLEVERLAWGVVRGTEDRQEGRAAFREKRPPQYRGR